MPFKSLEEQRRYKREWYKRNADKVKAEVAERKSQLVRQLQDYKETLSCTLCPEDDACCLEFHHPHDDKEHDVSTMPFNGISWDKIMLEIKKCVVVCRNCHAKLHAGKVSMVACLASNQEELGSIPTTRSNLPV